MSYPLAHYVLGNYCIFNRWCLQVYAQLLGREQLPWEGDRMTSDNWKKLGIFRHHVLKLLDRDPEKRMSAQHFAVACDSIFDSRSLTGRHRAFSTTK
jgi:hypothetical protein